MEQFAFGFHTQFGRAPSQVSDLFDKTGALWMLGGLVGKVCQG
jgi:NAD(P)H dehydrogenase (quinone)